MNRYLTATASCIILSLSGCTSKTLPAQTDAPSSQSEVSPEPLLRGRAVVLSIDRRAWTLTADGREMAGGPGAIWLHIVEPAQYQDPGRVIRFYDFKELVINGHELSPGDVITFEATVPVFLQRCLPDVLSNLVHLEVIPKTSNPLAP